MIETPRVLSGPSLPSEAEVLEEVKGMSASDIHDLRELCKADLFFLCKGVLGYREVSEEAHGALCQFMVQEPARRRLTLMPRGHFKSTICTIADSIRLALCNPDIRILICNETATNAEGFLSVIKEQWEKNHLLRFLFAELVPHKLVGPGSWWAQEEACLVRSSINREPTWSALGVGGAAVSRHFNHIKADDLIGERAKASETVMKATITWNQSIEPLLTRRTAESTDCIDWIGTRKGLYDLYSVLVESYNKLKVFSRKPVEGNEPILPSMFDLEGFEQIMNTTPDVWFSDYMNDPLGKGMQDWGQQGVQFFEIVGSQVHFRNALGELLAWEIADLDKVMILDPNSGSSGAEDKAAVNVIGTSPQRDTFVLESASERWSPDGLIDKGFIFADRWHPRVVGIEKAGQQNTRFYWEKRCRERGVNYRPVDLKHGNVEKATRIRTALDTPIKEHRLYIRKEQFNLRGQLLRFPQLPPHNWDEIDALGYYPQLLREGITEVELAKREAVRKKLLLMRGNTGYGVVGRNRLRGVG